MSLVSQLMPTRLTFRIGVVLLLLHLGSASQERSAHKQFTQVSIVQLIAMPERFNDKSVAAYGFLTFGEYPVLWLHKEDSDNLLIPNAVWIDPSADMLRNAREIEGKYVTVTGVFHAFQSGRLGYNNNAGMSGGLTEIRQCTVWSDPNHPFGHKYDDLSPPKLKQR